MPLFIPGNWAEAEAALRALLSEGESPNTLRSYQAALRYWSAWYDRATAAPSPCRCLVPVLQQFVLDHAQGTTPAGMTYEMPAALDEALVAGGFKARLGAPSLSTLAHRISVLSKVHQLMALDNPCQNPGIKDLLSKTGAPMPAVAIYPPRSQP